MADKNLPIPEPAVGRKVLRAFLQRRTPLAALEIMHREMGDIFRIPIPGFQPVVLVGPEANRFVLASNRDQLQWRVEKDPVVRLLRHGVLVEDGESHEYLRHRMMPPLHKKMMGSYLDAIVNRTNQVLAEWEHAEQRNMLVEMRKIALIVLMDTLFGEDFSEDLNRLWGSILRTLEYISPGLWIFWPDMPRPGYRKALDELDDYLFRIIRNRRARPFRGKDLLSILISFEDMGDHLIRDQLLTMLIAGHDTSTAALAWTLYLLGLNPDEMLKVEREIDAHFQINNLSEKSVANLTYLDQVLSESLRLYPPIHVGNRVALKDLTFRGYRIPAGTRVMYSIYLSHRDEKHWPHPDVFDPGRFSPTNRRNRLPYTYVAFGGGPRNCIGLAFAKIEIKVILACIFSQFRLNLKNDKVHPHMGATLEPRPGVAMQIYHRQRLS